MIRSVEDDYDPVAQFTATIQGSLNDNTDTRVRVDNVPGFVIAAIYTTCAGSAEFGGGAGYYRWCKRQLIILDPTHDLIGNVEGDPAFFACHELGHTAGLQHTANLHGPRVTCMDYDGDNNLDAHDEQHLTDCYPRPIPAPDDLTPLCKDYEPPPPPCPPCPQSGDVLRSVAFAPRQGPRVRRDQSPFYERVA